MPIPFSSLSVFEALPPPADESAAAIGLARWREAADDAADTALAEAMRALAEDMAGARLLASVFGNSPYLTQTCLKEPGFVMRLAEHGLDATFAEILDGLNHEVAMSPARAAVMAALRVAKRRAALTIALADLAGQWESGARSPARSVNSPSARSISSCAICWRALRPAVKSLPKPSSKADSSCSAWASSARMSSTIRAISTSSCCSTASAPAIAARAACRPSSPSSRKSWCG